METPVPGFQPAEASRSHWGGPSGRLWSHSHNGPLPPSRSEDAIEAATIPPSFSPNGCTLPRYNDAWALARFCSPIGARIASDKCVTCPALNGAESRHRAERWSRRTALRLRWLGRSNGCIQIK